MDAGITYAVHAHHWGDGFGWFFYLTTPRRRNSVGQWAASRIEAQCAAFNAAIAECAEIAEG